MQTQPVEDIEAVLGRFQAWAGLQHAAEVKPGIRELSYEEALASNRYRWKAGAGATAKKKPEVKDERRSEQVEAMMASDAEPQPAQQKEATARSNDARRGGRKKARGRHRARSGREAKPEPEQVLVKNAVTTVKEEPKATRPFKEALVEAVQPPGVLVPAQPLELTRQVAVSIRLAQAERALIKTRATEAGLTVSAYIRQCALEVEQLRAQVQQTLAVMERRAAQPSIATEDQSGRPGFLTRLMRRFLPAPGSRLALRA